MKTLLCVESQLDQLKMIRRFFSQHEFAVLSAQNLAQARRHLVDTIPDGIVLEIALPDGNGLDFMKELRSAPNASLARVPICILTVKNKDADIVLGLDAGADDYLGKPFSYDVLLARVRKMLTHAERQTSEVTLGPISINFLSGQAYIEGIEMALAQKERAMLLLFIQHPESNITAAYLYEKIWGQGMIEDGSAVKNTVSRLRKKLVGSGFTIVNERNEGYVLERE